MFISKKKYQALEKRIADLEGQVQSQQEIKVSIVADEISRQIAELLKERNKLNFY
ncbi:hypothetical protein KQI61_04485 [Anaerocolumna aminovalerica]|uniref:hypothetical protein n=1 Tax=Anaerocolumna aminovalerica TaxID=1527 RepID=UPI001C0E8FB6|nr:hypothetical protein [Anaerocolumna aminovalerica]MBU5331445.1 hypothetical protein [Anaerocolumna aminovalerica]